jgi:hypothetical protein
VEVTAANAGFLIARAIRRLVALSDGVPARGVGGILVATPPLYPAYAEQSVRLFGISPALDQRLAGLVMIGEQVTSLALCFAFLLPALRQEAAKKPLTTESQVLPVLTTMDGAFMEPRGRNRWQSVANRTGRKPA